MVTLSTAELKAYVLELYDKMRPALEKDGISKDITVKFTDEIAKLWPCDFCYSDGEFYHYGSVGDFGDITSEKYDDLFELTYRIFRCQIEIITIERKSKIKGKPQDSRRIAFPKQIELMRLIGEEYAERLERELNKILEEYPYSDEPVIIQDGEQE